MQIHRIILKDIRNFNEFDRSFEDAWIGSVPDSLLLIGPNGSGKTTILTAIASLWEKFYEVLTSKDEQTSSDALLTGKFFESFAAMEIIGLGPEPIWIITEFPGAKISIRGIALEQQNPKSHRIRVEYIWTGQQKEIRKKFWYTPPGNGRPIRIYGKYEPIREENSQKPPDWIENYSDRLIKYISGSSEILQNILFLESETRVLHQVSEAYNVQPEPRENRWLAYYEPSTSRKGSLQNFLFTLKVVDEETFKRIVEQVDLFLAPKKLNGFDQRTGSLLVKTENGELHPIEELSSGEKQVLIMIVNITRWLQPGGIVLIDEPDLHLHVSLMGALIRHLERMIAEKKGQLILASHAPDIWRLFNTSSLVRLESNDIE